LRRPLSEAGALLAIARGPHTRGIMPQLEAVS
jgi:hypothetical protein